MENRLHPRLQVVFELTLTRRRGNPVTGRTEDLGAGGMRITTDRPLSIDEELEFDLALDAHAHVPGRARVVRQQGLNCYALRFEAVDAALVALLSAKVSQTA